MEYVFEVQLEFCENKVCIWIRNLIIRAESFSENMEAWIVFVFKFRFLKELCNIIWSFEMFFVFMEILPNGIIVTGTIVDA